MCGRFVASRPVEDLVDQFDVDEVRIPPELLPGPRFNVSPQDEVLAVREIARPAEEAGAAPLLERRLGTYRWGLVPSWAKSPSVGARAFNARAETLLDKPMFRTALQKRRCIVPADAFYEWERLGHAPDPSPARRGVKRQPWCFRAADGQLLGFAGLYELWREDRDAEWLPTCTIITTDANGLMAPVHERMPVVLRPEDYEAWLSPGVLDPGELAVLLAPPADSFLVGYRVGSEVGNSRSEGPQLVEPRDESSESSSAPSGDSTSSGGDSPADSSPTPEGEARP